MSHILICKCLLEVFVYCFPCQDGIGQVLLADFFKENYRHLNQSARINIEVCVWHIQYYMDKTIYLYIIIIRQMQKYWKKSPTPVNINSIFFRNENGDTRWWQLETWNRDLSVKSRELSTRASQSGNFFINHVVSLTCEFENFPIQL